VGGGDVSPTSSSPRCTCSWCCTTARCRPGWRSCPPI
jgi:hypothetical protein